MHLFAALATIAHLDRLAAENEAEAANWADPFDQKVYREQAGRKRLQAREIRKRIGV